MRKEGKVWHFPGLVKQEVQILLKTLEKTFHFFNEQCKKKND